MVPPSGEQFEIRHGALRAVITEVGATLRTFTSGDRAVLDGWEADEPCTGGRGQTLIPWPNRIRGGRYRWRERTYQLDLTEPEVSGAIHGLTRWAPWRVVDRSAAHVRLRYVQHACPGWPFVIGAEIDYELEPTGLTVRTTATNLGTEDCPYGTGAHPYLHAGTPSVDAARVVAPAGRYLPVDEVGIPTGTETVEGTPYDLRRSSQIGDRRLDTAYTDLDRDADGRARVRLIRDDGSEITLWLDEAYAYLQLFTGDTLPDVERRRTGLAVEPMTCPPGAFNSGDGLVTLRPGESHTATWGIDLRRARTP